MKVDLHDRLEAVGGTAWDDLLARSGVPSPFLNWTWQEHWARAFAGDRRLEIRTVVDGAGRPVGILVLTHVIRDAIARGKARFDFLRGEERYKHEFGPTPEDVYQVRIA